MTNPIDPADRVAKKVERVAVVVVHGVADQRPGDTLKTVVELLTAAPPDGVAYEATESLDFALRVEPMGPDPRDAFDGPSAVTQRTAPASPDRQDRRWIASLRQSFRSDFHRAAAAREVPIAPSDRRQSRARAAGRPDAKADRGLQLTSYLLSKALRDGAPPEEYETRRTRLVRRAAGRQTQVDCFEMYWADLSRLSGSVPAIVSELFTLIFRLSNLARDTVAEACRYATANRTSPGRRWRALSFCQALLDWCFTNILAQLFAQLLLVGALIVLLGLAAPTARSDAIHPYLRVIGAVAMVLAVGVAFYFARAGTRWMPIVVGAGMAAVGASMVFATDAPWAYAIAVVALLACAYDAALRAANERFPAVLLAGRGLGIALLAWIAWHVVVYATIDGAWDRVLHGALAGYELVLWLIEWWWIGAAVVIVVWASLSLSTLWRPDDERASAATGRLGTLVSFAVFVTTAMALWAALEGPVEKAVETSRYEPVIWTTEPALTMAEMQDRADDPTFCVADHAPHPWANVFLGCRFAASTALFSGVAVLLLAVLGYLVLTMLPSVLAELAWTRGERPGAAERLGLWLTSLYRWLDPMMMLVTLVAVGAVLVGFGRWTQGAGAPWSAAFGHASREALKALVIPATTAFAALSAFGRYLSRTVPGLRGPLDAALDVDNWFREFPRTRIPRARIFARYRALMRRLRDARYDRIVIVAHSQGTVISAEFLRFVSSVSTDEDREDRRPRLGALMGCDVRLLTLGCPLRQLYATRFPTYYPWVLDRSGEIGGPRAADVGVEIWANAFGSGDYVGRWLWSAAATPPDGLDPLSDRLASDGRFGRSSIYEPVASAPGLFAHRRAYETCTGFGAHTHYFDLPATSQPTDRSIVACLIDGLVVGAHVPRA